MVCSGVVPVTGLDCHLRRAQMYGCHQFLNWWQQMPTGYLHFDGFESVPLTIRKGKDQRVASNKTV